MDQYVLVQMEGWRIWRSRSALELSGLQMLPLQPDESGPGRPPFGSLGNGDTLEVDYRAVVELPAGV